MDAIEARGLADLRSWRGCRRGLLASAAIAAVAAWLAMAARASACDTPVYRYAMYRWMPVPYEVYCLHHGKLPKADQELHQVLAEGGPGGAVANVYITPVDLDQAKALDTVPEPVKAAWKARAGKVPAKYVLMAPWGANLLAGDLDVAAARALVESPVRSEIGRLFHEGHGVVLLIVGGKEARENARVEAACRAVMARAEAGGLLEESEPGSDSSPPERPEEVGAQGGLEGQPPGLRIGLVKLDRANASERWLLKMLMTMAPDLEKSAHEPMLFAIYGRGRAMPPGIGQEVNAESLTEMLRFLAGRCSCTVKDQNPGLDLLMRWDWESTAERFAAEERAVTQVPLYTEMSADPAAPKGSLPDVAQAASLVQKPVPQAPVAVIGSPAPPRTAVPQTESPRAVVPQESFADRQRWQLGLGLIGAAVLVLAAGVVFLRRRNHDSP